MSLQGLLRNINFKIEDSELNKFKAIDHNIRHAYYTQAVYLLYQLKQFWRMNQLKLLNSELFDKEYLNLFTNVKHIDDSTDEIDKKENNDENIYSSDKMFQLLTEKINGIDIDSHPFNTKAIKDKLFENLNMNDTTNGFKVVWMVMDTKMSHSSLISKKIFDTCMDLEIFNTEEVYLYSTNKEIVEKLNYPSNMKFTDDKMKLPKNVDVVVVSTSAPVINRCSFYVQKIFGSNNENVVNRLPMILPIIPSIPSLKLRFAFGWHRTLTPWVDKDHIRNNLLPGDNSYISWKVERIPDEYIDIYLPSHCSGQMLVTGESKYEKASFQYRDFLDETYESFLNYCIGKLGISRPEAQQYVEIGLFNQIFKLNVEKRFPTLASKYYII
ncbi:hypothetical protein H8356DRAFT_920854 [Neocallimastix lanati (nom. inval.)]|uniref:Uncharacterized protein n=1 Tax=Neocallimastix californiae TaxID=1754190 RepID=A0A1Y2F4I2_9FUNG|nr:hypothetical protein H8356DRAFT_920854 [Neocallimastix sp. JGI-2020a]ORY78800.1 hypothetical protein LY90DRAFT_664961 [Neocallimastix californiae]|eukprot:ORY78800.1 hypothetical protein LY90DRAFT_664961 [Neocallimastix californiae]